jgi:benzodiazapine receptor
VTLARLGLGATGALVIALYAVLAVRWTGIGSAWAAALPRPSWQPPDIVFGVAWPLNFVAMAVAGAAVVRTAALRDVVLWLVLFAATVALALGWARAFYVHHHLGRAALLLIGAAGLTWGLVAVTAGLVGWAGGVLVPYAVWLTVASSLAVGYHHLGSRAGAARS